MNGSIWREKRLLLVILAILLAVNTVFFFTYRVQYENRLHELDQRLEQAKSQLSAAHRARITAQQELEAYRKTQRDVDEILNKRWATEQERLTALILEVKRLTTACELVPGSLSFDRTVTAENKNPGTRRVGATQAGITFTVEGTYQKVRRLINLLEHSDQFVIIDRISLSSMTGQTLTLNLHVKTLFRDTSAPPPRRSANQNL